MDFTELDVHITKYIQGNFNEFDILKAEIEKLQLGDVYVEIGIDEGKSFRVAHEYAKEGIFKIGIDIHDVLPHAKSIGRAPFMEQEGIVGIGKRGFYVHGDADEFADFFDMIYPARLPFVNLLLIDGHHDYESVKKNTLKWEPLVKDQGTIIFHDYDHPDTKLWLDEHYGNNKEIFYGKVVKVRK